MTIKQYQEILLLDTGSTMYDANVCDILGIDTNQSLDKVKLETSYFNNNERVVQFKTKHKLNKKLYAIEQDFLECTYEQFIQLERILAEGDNIKNIHRLISIYFRPVKWSWKKFRFNIEPYNIKRQEYISSEIRNNMELVDAN